MIGTMSYPYQYPENYSTPTTPHQSPWDIEQHQAELQPEQYLQPQPQAFSPTQTILLQEPPERIVPSQGHESSTAQFHGMHRSEARSDPGSSGGGRPRVHLDTTRPSISPVGSSIMPIRRSPETRQRAALSHPYRRPQSAAGGPTLRHRRDQDQHVRFAGQMSGPATRSIPHPSAPPSRLPSFTTSPTAAASASTPTPAPPRSTEPQAESRRFIIRSDVHYDSASKVITAMLELPGVKKSDLRVTLSTCIYNRCRQVAVSGRMTSTMPESGLVVKERKFGEFSRIFPVPPDTTPDDIGAEMQDGVLVLKISCGMPAESEDAHQIHIR